MNNQNLRFRPDGSKFNHVFVNDVPASQVAHIGQVMDRFAEFLKSPVATIVEVGTHKGGFTTLLANHKGFSSAKVHTFDIVDMLDENYVTGANTYHYLENVFVTNTVEKLVASPGTTLLFCDGGNKVKEFNLFSKFLKPGDFIFCHDYAVSPDKFERQIKNKVWNWLEIDYSKIAASIAEHNLTPVMPEIFENAVWGSFVKV
jgi:hypothetical protein